jgi:predicted CxxxxCH...CXXCH cytochrome family protein
VGAVIGAHGVTEHEALVGNCNKCHVDDTPTDTEYNHRDGLIEMVAPVHGQAGSFYDKNQNDVNEGGDASFNQTNDLTGAGLGNCSNTYCHGTDSFQWGTAQLTGYDHCTICHGDPVAGTADGAASTHKRAPGADDVGVDTAGELGTITGDVSTDPEVGAHNVHMLLPYAYTDTLNPVGGDNCRECHKVPAAIGDLDHFDSGNPAEVFTTNAAQREKADLNSSVPSYNPGTGQCSNVYCHGANMNTTATTGNNSTPTWFNVNFLTGVTTLAGDCDECHEAPPSDIGAHTGLTVVSECNACHPHFNLSGGFDSPADRAKHINGTIDVDADCVSCHDGVPSGATYVTRDIVSGDFTRSYGHVFGGSPTNWDCIICHREGDATDADSGIVTRDGTLHNNAGTIVVDLRNVDSIGTGWTWDKYDGTCAGGSGGDDINECVDGGGTWTWSTDAMLDNMDEFCMRCHDSDTSRGAGLGGASGIAVQEGTSDGEVTLAPSVSERTKPFNSTDELDAGTGGGTVSVAGYGRTAVLDVYGLFAPGNPSHHAVRINAYNSHTAAWGDDAWVDRTLKNDTQLITDSIYETADLHCADCHTVDESGHRGLNGFMLQATTIDGTCYLCHNILTYENVDSGQSRWPHDNDSSVWDIQKGAEIGSYPPLAVDEGSICRNCHGGDPDGDGFGGVHGLTSAQSPDPRSGEPRYRFQGGSYMSHSPSSWTGTTGGTPTCYFDPGTDTVPWSKCTQHSGTNTNRTSAPVYSRGTPDN